MDIHVSARPLRSWRQGGAFPLGLGLVAGLVLLLFSAVLFSTYDVWMWPDVLENARQLSLVYLAGEVALILYARQRGLDLREIAGLLPR